MKPFIASRLAHNPRARPFSSRFLRTGHSVSKAGRCSLTRRRTNWPNMVASPWDCSWESLDGWSRAHCYGMFPGYFLSAYVLGVRRDAPVAEKKILIEPHPGDLTNADGVVVTEFGPVPVSWSKEGDALHFRITTPKNAATTLALPLQPGRTEVQLDGRKQAGVVRGSRLIFELKPGKHIVKVAE